MRYIKSLIEMEGLAMRKASLYGRTLTDVALAEFMQELAELHAGRGNSLAELAGDSVDGDSSAILGDGEGEDSYENLSDGGDGDEA